MSNRVVMHEGVALTLKNYKEPLRPVENGFGYYGAILVTLDGEGIQCHICGEIKQSLAGHIWGKHKIKAKPYKKKFFLAYDTALVSENHRKKLQQNQIDWWNSLNEEQQEFYREKSRLAIEAMNGKRVAHGQKIKLETKNKRGTCPDQLLAKILEAKTFYKRTPTQQEFVEFCGTQRYKHLIYTTFGSWKKAVEMAGLELAKGKSSVPKKKQYSREELLEYIVVFYKKHKRPPTESDCRRGLLPGGDVYRRRFGSLPKAKAEAGIVEKKRHGHGGTRIIKSWLERNVL